MEAFIERLAAVQAENAEPEQAEEPDPVSAPSDTGRLKEGCLRTLRTALK